MKKLISFNDKFYSVYSCSLAAFCAAFLLKNNGKKVELTKRENNKITYLENFYIPERIQKHYKFPNLKRKKIKFYYYSENFVLPITNTLNKFILYLSNILDKSEIKKIENFELEDISIKLNGILTAIAYIYGIYNFENLNNKLKIQILKDFFSNNFYITNNYLSNLYTSTHIFHEISLKKKKILSDCDIDIRNFSYFEYKIEEFEVKIKKELNEFFPSPIFFNFKNTKAIIEKNRIKIFKGDIDEALIIFYEINPHIKKGEIFIEKSNVKYYRALSSNDKSYVGKYAFFPINLYTIFDSILKLTKIGG